MTPDLKALVERLRRNAYYVKWFDEAADAVERLAADREKLVEQVTGQIEIIEEQVERAERYKALLIEADTHVPGDLHARIRQALKD